MAQGDWNSLVVGLEAIVSKASALTLGEPAAAGVDAEALVEELDSVLGDFKGLPGDLVSELERAEARLETVCARSPAELVHAALDYRYTRRKWRPDPPPMPPEFAAFRVLGMLERARGIELYLRARSRYEALEKAGDLCDCAACLEAQFFADGPKGPLRIVDEDGVPEVMEYLLVCEACGSKWSKQVAHDDAGPRDRWAPAARDATRA